MMDDARKEAMQTVKMYQASGWDVRAETEAYILMESNVTTTFGHLLVFLLFGWWTLGLANLAYHFIGKRTKKIVK